MEFLKMLEAVLRRKWLFVGIFLFFFVAFAAGSILVRPTYQAIAKLFVHSSSALSSLLTELDVSQNNTSVNSDEDVFETRTALVQLRPLLEELIQALELKDRCGKTMEPDKLVDPDLLNKLFPQPRVAIKQHEDSALIKITSTSSSPKEAAKISNELARLYVDYNLKRAQEEFAKVKEFIQGRLVLLRANYDKALADLAEFKTQAGIANLETEMEGTLSRLNELRESYEDNEQSIVLLEREIKSGEDQLRKLEKYRKESVEFSKNSGLLALKEKLNDLFVGISSKGMIYQKEHPEYKQLEKEIETVKELIGTSEDMILNKESLGIEPAYDSVFSDIVSHHVEKEVNERKRALLTEIVSQYQGKMAEYPYKSAELTKLELSVSAARDLYESFLTYLNKVEAAEVVAISDTRIVELAAVPKRKTFPKKSVMLVLGVFLGTLWGLAAVFFLEYIDISVRTPSDLEHLGQFSLLGSMPRARHLPGRSLPDNSPLAEACRSIRHNLRMAFPEHAARSILVTSAGDGEGKTTVAACLALSFAAARSKTLLVDLNLRRPALVRCLALPGKQGIAEVVRGELSVKEAVCPGVAPGLDVLAAGRASHPAAIIDAEGLPKILAALAQGYDVVVIDAPSFFSSSDAIVLGTETDCVICVAECGKTAAPAAEQMHQRLRQAGIRQTGWVLNRCSANRPSVPRGSRGQA